ncbi:nose resistant to fluoxetine protein 6-like [Centruroides sculpturatus]|uniref:nose resistant to fluoxetine protein 6-like n=1 Tax=Centruroides sculpturatus TaxID=218467 RepID=UPI000C6EEE62|nr:nose resistant to fluoxetine protein 6-like [Centruroides sculpturatus]
MKYITSVSLHQSTRKLVHNCNEVKTAAFCGIKFLLINVFVFGHIPQTLFLELGNADRYYNFSKIFTTAPFEIASRSYITMETFFFVSGYLFSNLQRRNVNSQIFYGLVLIKRLIRLTLPVLCVLAIMIVLPHFGDGPLWNKIVKKARYTEENWFRFVSHTDNFGRKDIEENSHLWFISVLAQQSFPAVALLYLRNRWARIGNILTVFLIVAGMVSHIAQLLISDDIIILGFGFNAQKVKNYFLYNASKPYYSHLSSFFLGFFFGYLLLEKKEIKFKMITQVFCWICSITIMMLVLFGLHGYIKDPSPNETVLRLYIMLSPFAWTASTAWICIACVTGHGGIVNRILSMKIFCMLDRLIIWVYLLHFPVIYYIFCQARTPFSVSMLNLWTMYAFVMMLTLIISYFVYAFVETPSNYLLQKTLDLVSFKDKSSVKEYKMNNMPESQEVEKNSITN